MAIIEIHLIPPRGGAHYLPGDPVIGNVMLYSKKDEGVGKITVSLRGKCKTRIVRRQGNRRRFYKGVASLFELTTILYTGHYTLRAGQRYLWPFQFIFPTRSASTAAGWRDCPFFSSAQSQFLPPSCEFRHGSDWGYVHYKLKAVLNLPAQGPLLTRNHKVSRGVLFSTIREEEVVDPHMIRFIRECQRATLRLKPGHEERRLKPKESLYSLLHPSRLPRSIFRIELDVPKFAVVGARLPMFVGITHQADESTAPVSSSTVHLKRCQVFMTTKTMIRCPRIFFGDEIRKWTSRTKIFDFKPPSSLPLNGHIDLQNLGVPNISAALQPEFFAVCISRWYSLTVKVTIACAKKQYSRKFKLKDITLLPSYVKRSDPRPLVQVADAEAEGNLDEFLPQYQSLSPPPPSTVGTSRKATTQEPAV
ncbi:MAG: hypothetical protein M1812_004442 [Candelaria pacifica]|nr:MAG: hypothetical protein M1812_004442 [Candelaria pacifica]